MNITPSAVILDLFDTLVPGGSRANRDALSRRMADELGVDREHFAAAFRSSFRQRWTGELGTLEETIATLTTECGGVPDDGAVRKAARLRLEFTRRQITPGPAVLATLRALRSDSWRLGLVSNCSAEVPMLWAGTPLSALIDAPVFSCQVGACKPDPLIYRHAAAVLEVLPEQCVFVADGAGGELPGARNAGMKTIRVQATDVDHTTYGAIGDWSGSVLTSLGELPAFLSTRYAELTGEPPAGPEGLPADDQ